MHGSQSSALAVVLSMKGKPQYLLSLARISLLQRFGLLSMPCFLASSK
jgi:hypothetical protein